MNYKQFPLVEILVEYDVVKRTPDSENHRKEAFLHFCDQIQVFYNRKGCHRLTIDEVQYETVPGDLIVIQPYHAHEIECKAPDCVYHLVQFSPAIFDVISGIPHLKTDVNYWILQSGISHTNFLQLNDKQKTKIEALFDEYDGHSGFGFDMLRFSTFLKILVYLSVFLKKDAELKNAKSSKIPLSQKVIEYIDRHFMESIVISDIAKQLYVNEKYLCTAFKQQTGITIKQYINHCRIYQAKKFLNDITKTPQDAFEHSGFSDYSTFYRAFKKNERMSPRQFQEMVAKRQKTYPQELQKKWNNELPED